MATPPPIEHDADLTGGGTPNRDDRSVLGDQISPASIFPVPVSDPRETMAAAEVEEVKWDCPVAWDGAPTPGALRALLREVRTPRFDAERAVELLDTIAEGNTMKRALEMTGLSRATVLAWESLVPAFAAEVAKAETALGRWYRDCAAEDADDPALMSARLRLAASYDRKIRTGDEQEGGSLTVQVLKLG